MNLIQKIINLSVAILMIISGLLLILLQDAGLVIVALIISLSLIIYGIRTLVYYFTMARHMVGGKFNLITGILVLDLGLFTLTMAGVPKIYIIIYLIILYAFSGVIDIMRAFEAKKFGASSWKLKLITGIIELLIAAACGVFADTGLVVVGFYALGLIYSAVMRIISAFRKSAIVYIQ